MEKKGITIHLNALVQSIEHNGAEAVITYKENVGESSGNFPLMPFLLATGRRPNTTDLNTEAAGIQVSDRGAIVVDEHLHTNVPDIWAMGDVTGGLSSPISLDDYRVIRDELFGSGRRTKDDRVAVAYSVFIDPPLSRIGMGRRRGLAFGKKDKYRTRIPAAAFPRTRTFEQTDGPTESDCRYGNRRDTGLYPVLRRIDGGYQYRLAGYTGGKRLHIPEG